MKKRTGEINLDHYNDLIKGCGIAGDNRSLFEANLLGRLAAVTSSTVWQRLVDGAYLATQCRCENNGDLCEMCVRRGDYTEAQFVTELTAPTVTTLKGIKRRKTKKSGKPLPRIATMGERTDATPKE